MPPGPVLEPASPLAGAIVSLYWIVTAIAAVVFIFVAGRDRAPPTRRPPSATPAWRSPGSSCR